MADEFRVLGDQRVDAAENVLVGVTANGNTGLLVLLNAAAGAGLSWP